MADINTLSPDQFNNLGVPDFNECVSIHTLSVQTAFITSVECLLSSNYYIQSGFNDIDNGSNNVANNSTLRIRSGVEGIEDMLLNLQCDLDQEIKSKLDAVVFMTVNFYKKQDLVVPKTNIQLGDLTDIINAQSVLVVQRCQSSYFDYLTEMETIRERYVAEISIMDYKHFGQEDWLIVVKEYNEANEEVFNKSSVYASIRDAFMLGSGINICQSSSSFNEKLLVGHYFFILNSFT